MNSEANAALSPEQIDAVLSFLPIFEREDFVPSKVAAPPGQFPYHVFDEQLTQFHQTLYASGFVVSFDWPEWQDTARGYLEQPERLQTADLLVLRKLLTLHVRKERFCEGHLSIMIQCGHIPAILRRLKELKEAGLIE
jgi:hypothetical protein